MDNILRNAFKDSPATPRFVTYLGQTLSSFAQQKADTPSARPPAAQTQALMFKRRQIDPHPNYAVSTKRVANRTPIGRTGAIRDKSLVYLTICCSNSVVGTQQKDTFRTAVKRELFCPSEGQHIGDNSALVRRLLVRAHL